jgi:hypothetical protein
VDYVDGTGLAPMGIYLHAIDGGGHRHKPQIAEDLITAGAYMCNFFERY